MRFVDYLKKNPTIANILYAILFLFFTTWIFSIIINFYTLHNKYVEVPDFTGVSVNDLDSFIKDKDFKYVVSDTIYDININKAKGTVYSQDPVAKTKVKSGRKVYLTIVATTPKKINMPDLVDLTLRQALSTLDNSGLKLGRIDYVHDIAENAVLKQKHKGVEIKPGTLIDAGSKINLVVGSGVGNKSGVVPNIIGKTHSEAIAEINDASLNVGSEIYENDDKSEDAVVIKQRPSANSKASMGTSIDIWFGKKKKSENEE